MSVVFSKDLPAFDILKEEGVNVVEDIGQDVDLHIAILNLMPTKQATETQLLRLIAGAKHSVRTTLLTTATYKATHTPTEYMSKFYTTFDKAKDARFDALIVTGAPVEHLRFEDVIYWQELADIMDYAKANIKSTLYICWGAQAALYHFYDISKIALSKKLFGIFKAHPVVDGEPLFYGIDNFYIPNSRHTTIDDADTRANVKVLAEIDECGIAIAKSKDNKSFFFTGHSEYDRYTLRTEYLRDLSKGLEIDKPINYFADDVAVDCAVAKARECNDIVGALCDMAGENLNDVPMIWRQTAQCLFANWIDNYTV